MPNKINPESQWDELSSAYATIETDHRGFPYNELKQFQNVKFLEAGSGDGEVAIFMAKDQKCEVVGLEIADSFIKMSEEKISKRKIENITILKGDVRNIPFKDEVFDLIYSGGVIEHFSETFDSLNEHVRVLKPGGYILIGVPCKQGLHYPLKLIMRALHIWEIGYEQSFTKKYFQDKLKKSGLKIEKYIFRPLEESSNQKSLRHKITKIFSKLDKAIGGTHMQYYLCKKL